MGCINQVKYLPVIVGNWQQVLHSFHTQRMPVYTTLLGNLGPLTREKETKQNQLVFYVLIMKLFI